jgi:fumarate hydratase class II
MAHDPVGTDGPRPTTRIEHDAMGEVEVPAEALWQAQTQRAVENFPISGLPIEAALVHALGAIKAAAARANAELGRVDPEVAAAIAAAADEVAAGRHDAQFPIDVFQTGSGTSSNMNTNEVVATLASASLGRKVHPNDHVNSGQSSNDVFPTAIHVAAATAVTHELIPALRHLAGVLRAKADELATVVKAGRTHLMDATPVTLGQEMGGYATAVEKGIERLEACLPRVAEVPLGGTAVGTGLNCPPGLVDRVLAELSQRLGVAFTEAPDHFEAQGARDSLVELSGAMKVVAVSLYKAANDLRWMGSGPRTGLAEIRLPDLQPGSSIMPGKVNPVLPEAVCQVVAQVVGSDATVAFAGAAGNFELNVMLPVLARNVLEPIRLLANVSRLLADRCIAGIEADVERCRTFAEASPQIVTSLAPHVGYEVAAKVVKESLRTGKTVRQLVLEQQLVPEDRLDEALDVLRLTRPGLV